MTRSNLRVGASRSIVGPGHRGPVLHCLIATAGTAYVAAVTAPTARAGLFGPSTYDECITESMHGVSNAIAARDVRDSCRRRFPDTVPADDRWATPPAPKPLPPAAVERLDGQLRTAPLGGGLHVNVYNGNRDWEISSVTLQLETVPPDGKAGSAGTTRAYQIDLRAAPPCRWVGGVSAIPCDGRDSRLEHP